MLHLKMQASGDPRMAQILTWISGSTYSATPELVMRSGAVMLVLLTQIWLLLSADFSANHDKAG